MLIPDTPPQASEVKSACQLNMAAVHVKRGECKEAVACCDKVLKSNGQSVKALFRRAQARAGEGDYDLAEDDYENLTPGR